MSIKVIAIGNALMADDGIGIRVLEKIKDELQVHGIEAIIGETDFEYCISCINKEDFIFIIDASHYGENTGDITITPLSEYENKMMAFNQHEYSLLGLIHTYCKGIKGCIIGIKVEKINYDINISGRLQERFNEICSYILKSIIILSGNRDT